MPDLIPSSSGGFYPSRITRQTNRALEQIRADQAIVSSREIAKVETIGEVTEAALLATSHVSALEALLAARTPHAAGRLQHIADVGALGMAEVVLKAKRGVL